MKSAYVTDDLWKAVEPLLPREKPKPKGGRPRLDDRSALNGILFVLVTGIGWERLPPELGFGSGMTCWRRRLRDWHEAGVWSRLHANLLERLSHADAIDWSRVSVDASSVRAPKGGTARRGRTRPTEERAGTKRHLHSLVVDRKGIPLAFELTGANVHDTTRFKSLIDALPTIHRKRGRPKWKPDKAHADKGFDSRSNREHLESLNIEHRIARRGIESKERLGLHRWVVERSFSHLNQFRRLSIRWERTATMHEALILLACSLICLRRIP